MALADLFEQGEDVEGEEAEAARGEQARLLDGQHTSAVRSQRVDHSVGHRIPGIAQAGRHRAIYSYRERGKVVQH